jgi:hypothetical protein
MPPPEAGGDDPRFPATRQPQPPQPAADGGARGTECPPCAATECTRGGAATAEFLPAPRRGSDCEATPSVPEELVSHSCACIGSPCLRNCVHGASIGGGAGYAGGAGGAAGAVASGGRAA